MSFIEQTAKVFGNIAEFKFQAIMFGRDALYLEGAKPVKLDNVEMIFKTSGGLITVSGERLTVKDIIGDCVAVVGKINGFTVNDL